MIFFNNNCFYTYNINSVTKFFILLTCDSESVCAVFVIIPAPLGILPQTAASGATSHQLFFGLTGLLVRPN